MAVDEKDAEVIMAKAKENKDIKSFMDANPDAKVQITKMSKDEVGRIMKEHPGLFGLDAEMEVISVLIQKPGIGIPEDSQKRIYLDPKTKKVLKVL